MFKIAVIEDEKKWADEFTSYIRLYFSGLAEQYSLEVFSDGIDFISDYKGGYDLILMDIAMPHMNGLETAHRLREVDENVCLIFITTMAKYAIKGYEVNAFDFLVKPVAYELFCLKLDKVRALIGRRRNEFYPVVSGGVTRMVPLAEILYVESDKHYIYFHTAKDQLRMRATLGEIKPFFKENGFTEINRSLLINLAHVEGYSQAEVKVGGEKLPLSRIYRAEFLDALTNYMGRKL